MRIFLIAVIILNVASATFATVWLLSGGFSADAYGWASAALGWSVALGGKLRLGD